MFKSVFLCGGGAWFEGLAAGKGWCSRFRGQHQGRMTGEAGWHEGNEVSLCMQ